MISINCLLYINFWYLKVENYTYIKLFVKFLPWLSDNANWSQLFVHFFTPVLFSSSLHAPLSALRYYSLLRSRSRALNEKNYIYLFILDIDVFSSISSLMQSDV